MNIKLSYPSDNMDLLLKIRGYLMINLAHKRLWVYLHLLHNKPIGLEINNEWGQPVTGDAWKAIENDIKLIELSG